MQDVATQDTVPEPTLPDTIPGDLESVPQDAQGQPEDQVDAQLECPHGDAAAAPMSDQHAGGDGTVAKAPSDQQSLLPNPEIDGQALDAHEAASLASTASLGPPWETEFYQYKREGDQWVKTVTDKYASLAIARGWKLGPMPATEDPVARHEAPIPPLCIPSTQRPVDLPAAAPAATTSVEATVAVPPAAEMAVAASPLPAAVVPAATTLPTAAAVGVPAASPLPAAAEMAVPAATTLPAAAEMAVPAATTLPATAEMALPAASPLPAAAAVAVPAASPLPAAAVPVPAASPLPAAAEMAVPAASPLPAAAAVPVSALPATAPMRPPCSALPAAASADDVTLRVDWTTHKKEGMRLKRLMEESAHGAEQFPHMHKLWSSGRDGQKQLLREWVLKDGNAGSIEAQIVLQRSKSSNLGNKRKLLTVKDMKDKGWPDKKIRAILSRGEYVEDEDCPDAEELRKYWCNVSTELNENEEVKQTSTMTIQAAASADAVDMLMTGPGAASRRSNLSGDSMDQIMQSLQTAAADPGLFIIVCFKHANAKSHYMYVYPLFSYVGVWCLLGCKSPPNFQRQANDVYVYIYICIYLCIYIYSQLLHSYFVSLCGRI